MLTTAFLIICKQTLLQYYLNPTFFYGSIKEKCACMKFITAYAEYAAHDRSIESLF